MEEEDKIEQEKNNQPDLNSSQVGTSNDQSDTTNNQLSFNPPVDKGTSGLLDSLVLESKHEMLQKELKPSIWGTHNTTHDFHGYNFDKIYGGTYSKAAKQGDWTDEALPDDIALDAYKTQTTSGLIYDAVVGGTKMAAAGFLDSLASLDITDMANTFTKSSFNEVGNWLQKISGSLKDSAGKKNMIYQDGDDIWNLAYWSNQFKSLGFTAGITAETLLEQAALSTLGPEANMFGLAEKSKLLNIGKEFVFGMTAGVREGYINARDTGDTVYNKMLNAGYSQDEALDKAGEAAAIAFRTELTPLMALNAGQFTLMFGSLGKARAFESNTGPELKFGYSDNLEHGLHRLFGLGKIKNKWLRKGLEYGIVGPGTEATEEVIQNFASSYGQYEAGKGTKIEEPFDPFNTQTRDEAIGGFLGGILFNAGSGLVNKYRGRRQKTRFEKQYNDFMQSNLRKNDDILKAVHNTQTDYNNAKKEYDKNPNFVNKSKVEHIKSTYNHLKKNVNLVNTIQALQFDYLKGDRKAFNMYVTNMQSQLNAVNNNDLSTLQQFGIIKNGKEVFPGSISMIRQTFEDNIKDANKVKDLIESNLNTVTSDFDIAAKIAQKDYEVDSVVDDLSTINNEINSRKQDDKIYQFATNKEELDQLINYNALKSLKDLTPNQQKELDKIPDEIKNKNLTDYLPNSASYVELKSFEHYLSSLKDNLIKDASNMKTKEHVEKEIKSKKRTKKNKLKEARNIDELNKAKENLEDLDEEDQKIADTKEKEYIVKDEIRDNSQNLRDKQVPETIKEDTVEGQKLESEISSDSQDNSSWNNYIDDLKNRLDRDPDFDDVIDDRIRTKGLKDTETNFNKYLDLYDKNNDPVYDSQDIYSKYFTPDSVSSNELDDNSNDQDKIEQLNNETESEVKQNLSAQKQFLPGSENTYEFDYDDKRVANGSLKFAYNFQDAKYENSKWVLKSNNLKPQENDLVKNHYILDPEFMNKVRNEENSLTLKQLDQDNADLGSKTWGEMKKEAQEKFKDNPESYQNWFNQRVPVGIMYKGDTVLSLIHNNNWYNDRNVNDVTGHAISDGITNVTDIRNELADQGVLSIKLENDSQSSFGQIQRTFDKPISINESTGDTTIGQISSSNGVLQILTSKSNGGKYFPGKLVNSNLKVFSDNINIVHINQIGVNNDGEPLYMAFPTMNDSPIAKQENLQNDLNSKFFNSIKYAVLSSVVLNNVDNSDLLNSINKTYKFTESNAQAIKTRIEDETGMDITTSLGNYTDLFVRSNYDGGLTSVLNNSKVPTGLTYLNTNKDGSIEFIFKGGNSPKKTLGNKHSNTDSILENLNSFLGDEGLLKKSKPNVNLNALNNDFFDKLSMIDKNGQFTDTKSYDDHIKDVLKTNIVSHKIKSIDGKDKWITDVQPMFYFDKIEKVNPVEVVSENIKKVPVVKRADGHSENTLESSSDILDYNDQKQLLGSLKHMILNDLDPNNLKYSQVKKAISNSIENYVRPQLEENKKYLDENGSNKSLEKINSKLEDVIVQKDKLINHLNNEFSSILSVNLLDENFKTFFEKDIKLSYSNALKFSLFGIPKKVDGIVQKNSVGLTEFNSADDVNLKLLDITTSISSSWDLLNQKLDDNHKQTGNELYKDLKNKLNDLPQHLRNELLYKTIAKKLTIWKVLNSVSGTSDAKVYNINVLDENSSKETVKLKLQLERDYLSSSFAQVSGNDIILNKDYANKTLDELKQVIKDRDESRVPKMFNKLSLQSFNNNTVSYLLQQQGTTLPSGRIRDIFGSYGILGMMYKELSNTLDSKDDVSLVDNNLFKNINTPLRDLINIETMLNKSFVSNSINVNGKTIASVIPNTSLYDINQRLGNDESLVDKYLSVPYTANNYVLKLLKSDSKYKQVFKDIGFSSPEALKIHGKTNLGNADFDKIGTSDNIATILGLYMNTRSTKLSSDIPFKDYKTLSFRVGQMPILTLSDKGRMVYQKLPLLNLKGKHLNITDKISIDDKVLNFLVDQVFTPEYNRILQSYTQKTNITSYDLSSKVFHFLPSFNSISIQIGNKTLNIHDILSNIGNDGIKSDYLEQIKDKAKEKITDYVNSQVDKKISSDGKSGELVDFGFYDDGDLHNINTNYVNEKPGNTTLDKFRYSTSEFVINNLLNQVNTVQLYTGDLSFYSKNKYIPTISDNRIDTEAISNPAIYGQMSRDISTQLQKRTASLIAPGLKLADSENPGSFYSQDFIHLALNDVLSTSSVLKKLIENQYGKFNKTTNNAWEKLQEYKNLKQENPDRTDLDKKISNLKDQYFSEVADYFDITGTDAQEYTTWKTHLDMLFRQGKITEDQYKNFDITKDANLILQPIKPVYTSVIYDSNHNIMRPVYIKSSSIPLIPSVTANLKIDNLRNTMETLEAKYNKPVRVSYQSANKIGSMDTNLNMEDLYSKSFNDLDLESAMSVLPMANFKIQQETPSKETKYFDKGQDSHIRMGSQFFKILFGNFINHSDSKIFDNLFSDEILGFAGLNKSDKLSGKELYDVYNSVYDKYSDFIKKDLEDELGFESKSFDQSSVRVQNDIIKNLQNILNKEISERDYPNYLKEAVNLVDVNGKLYTEGTLIFDNNRHKFESLLQSIISNRLITHSLPGNAHIAASSEGFEKQVTLSSLNVDQKKGIVWVDGYKPELKPTYVTAKDGKDVISKSQVLIASHFKAIVDGNYQYIDLTSDKYSENIVEDGKVVGRKLKKDMIDSDLLSNFSFRIPTSSHQSGALLEVVGFLPREAGDMLVVPKEHTVQIGEDYDIDKRNVYKSNYFVTPESKIEKLKWDIIKQYPEEYNNLLSALFKEQYDDISELGNNKYETQKQIKLLENALIDVYKSIYSSTDNSVQQKIFKPLVTDISDTTSSLMDRYLKDTEDLTNFSLLSDDYQRYLLNMGSSGKDGIGIHSNAVVLESQLQRLDDKVKLGDIESNEDGTTQYKPFSIQIGALKFDDVLGKNQKTLDGSRDIADQHGENQNVSTDNVNKQIMGKRNENKYTMGIYALMAHMGFDLSNDVVNTSLKDKNGNSIKEKLHIPSLFINQPIIRDYVKLREKYDSLIGDFIKDKDSQIIEDLSKDYGYDLQSSEDNSKNLTGQFLWDNLRKDIALTSPQNQKTILDIFLKLNDKAKNLTEVQRLINVSTSKLGVSYFNTLERIRTLNSIVNNDLRRRGLPLSNYTKLIGEYSVDPKEGYTKVGQHYWKPTTVEGKMLINSLLVADKTMPIFFPYNTRVINDVLSGIFNNKGISLGDNLHTDWKYEIMTEFVNYINSSIFNDNINTYRKNLFFDGENNTSIGSILKFLKDSKNPIMENLLLGDLTFQKDIRTGITEIRHTPDEQTMFDTLNKHDAFLDLITNNKIITDKSGEPIVFNDNILTTFNIAQDLVSYSYMSQDNRGATGFKNYIPYAYLRNTNVLDKHREHFEGIVNNHYTPDFAEQFIKQYFQHNPNRAVVMSKEDFNNIDEDSEASYVSVRSSNDNNNLKQWDLYHLNESTGKYEQLSVLGTTNSFNEYNIHDENQKSIINDNPSVVKDVTEKDLPFIEIEEKLKSYNNVNDLVNYISDDNYKELISSLGNININLRWSYNLGSLVNYNPKSGFITINPESYKMLSKTGISFKDTQKRFSQLLIEKVMESKVTDFLLSDSRVKTLFDEISFKLPYNEYNPVTFYSNSIDRFVEGLFDRNYREVAGIDINSLSGIIGEGLNISKESVVEVLDQNELNLNNSLRDIKKMKIDNVDVETKPSPQDKEWIPPLDCA